MDKKDQNYWQRNRAMSREAQNHPRDEAIEKQQEQLEQRVVVEKVVTTPHKSYKKLIIISIFVILFIGGCMSLNQSEKNIAILSPDDLVENIVETVTPTDEEENPNLVVHTIKDGDIPAAILGDVGGLSANEIVQLLKASEDVYDLTNIKLGRDFRFHFDDEKNLQKIEYVKDTESVITAVKDGENFSVEDVPIAYEVELVTASGKITTSLYADALLAGIQEATVIEMADILAFDVNFFVDVQPGNEFVVYFEKRTLHGERGPDGRVLAARYVSDRGESEGFFFDSGNYAGYYDADGHELRKQFLQAPLSYKRITSGFTGARLHPVIGVVTPHYQIDYAAPTGTPVVSTANGVVTSAGFETGWGNIVRIRHENGYTTHYAHLSGYANGIRSGSRVNQGQTVGFVGNTGWSTGPHLDYGMRQNGSPVNPLTLKQPKGEPIAEQYRAAFEEDMQKYRAALDQN